MGSPRTSYLTKAGELGGTPETGWSRRIGAGVPTVADSGVALFSGALQGLLSIPTVDPRYLGRSTLGTSVSFSSPAGDPARLVVPIA